MKLTAQDDWDVLLVKISAMALLTIALTWLPQAIGSLIQIGTILLNYPLFGEIDTEAASYFKNLKMQLFGVVIGHLVSFATLLFLARWMFSYPVIIRKALLGIQPIPEEKPLSTNFNIN